MRTTMIEMKCAACKATASVSPAAIADGWDYRCLFCSGQMKRPASPLDDGTKEGA